MSQGLSKAFRLCAAGLMLAGAAPVAAQGKRFTLDDYDRLVPLSGIDLSADGRRALLVVGRANLEENRYDRELLVVDVAPGAARISWHGSPGLAHPRFSPKGDRIAYLAEVTAGPDGSGRLQVHLLAEGGEPRVLTRAPSGVDAFAFSPAGNTVAFSTADPAPE